MTVCADAPAAADRPAIATPLDEVRELDKPRLPVWQIVGLLGSGAFAFWTSLTCFVC